jgi:hypothetical protein
VAWLRVTPRIRRAPRVGSRNGRKPAARSPLPATVVVRPELFRTIAGSAAASGHSETGGPLFGTVQRSWEGPRGKLLVSVLATVPPGPRARGTAGSIALGASGDGERAASALRWWRAVTGLELLHIGDWHKHPSGLPEPSAGDHATAHGLHAESAAAIWLTAIAVSEHLRKADAGAEGSVVRFNRASQDEGQVQFHRYVDGAGLVPVPIRVEGDAIPSLPELPWHITDPARFAAEFRLLRAAGFSVGVDPRRSGRHPGLALRIARDGGRPLRVITGPGYPHDPPVVLDDRDRRLPPRGRWSADRFLVDLVSAPSKR